MAYIPPVIVLPGVMGTDLCDAYQFPPDLLWNVLQHNYTRLALHPDNPRFEAQQPARVQPNGIFEVAYKELIHELRHNLCAREDQPVPVYPFGYDWRQPLKVLEAQFTDFVEEVIERTKLLRHYANAGYAEDPKVNLVGHSMGGLIITGYLETKGKAARVGKVVTLATPFRGSFEAPIKVITGTAALGVDDSSSREREAARLTPSLYHMLPMPEIGLEIVGPDLPQTLYDPRLWQPSVVQTITEYVRLHGVAKTDRAQQASKLFAQLLETGQAFRKRIDAFRLTKTNLRAKDWLCVVGVDSVTRVGLKIKATPKGPAFDLSAEYRLNNWKKATEDRQLTGDGTVPFKAAVPPFLDMANVVCVNPEDFGYWEVQDRLLCSVAGFHGILPNMDMLQRMIVRHFTDRPDVHGNTWGCPAPGVNDWQPPLKLRAK